MTGPLKEQIENRLPWLFQDLGFRVTYSDYSPKYFGDSLVVIQSDSLRLRFVREKSMIGLALASLSEPDQWMELGFLWLTLTGDRPDPDLEGWAWFFREHLAELTDALGPRFAQTKLEYKRRDEEGRKLAARYIPALTWRGRLNRFRATTPGMIVMGPLGWIVVAGWMAWEFVK